MLERVFVIARLQVKSIDDEVGALRGALERVRELERGCPHVVPTRSRRPRGSTSWASSIRKGAYVSNKPRMVSAGENLELMKEMVEEFKVLDEKARPQLLGVDCLLVAGGCWFFATGSWLRLFVVSRR